METTQQNIRYTGTPFILRSFMYEFLVECPKCSQLATVTSKAGDYRLVCHSCKFTEKEVDRIRYVGVVKRACDTCGLAIDYHLPVSKEKLPAVTLPCSHCGVVRTYKPKYSSIQLSYSSHGKGDPIFNLPLWLQTDYKGEQLWAYNRAHLSAIRDYIAAKLRERRTPYYTTMVEKLPNFIKLAKNRNSLIKDLDRLSRK